jgi:hypothetical protein
VELSWFSREDVSNPNNPQAVVPVGTNVTLPPAGQWNQNTPAMMRAQMIQTGANFSLDQFNDAQDNKSNTNTLFLYPKNAGANALDFFSDTRRSPLNAPRPVLCQPNLATNEYACTIRLRMPPPVDGNTANRNAYLHLGALYNNAHFQIKLLQGSNPVRFDNVQPVVDSTGRANDAFRRVQARVQLSSDYTYPQAVIDLEGDLCKNFTITDQDSGYSGSTTCTP